MIVVVLAGANARCVGLTVARYAKKRRKLLVRFPGLGFPREYRAVDVDNLRLATPAEIARMEA
jgi:hypothetical protein